MKTTFKLALVGAVLGVSASSSFAADAPNCFKVSEAVKTSVAAQPSKVLELVSAHVAANESCACEVVRAAITAVEADKTLVGQIVRVASTSAPSQARVIAQCAIATAPDAIAEIQAVLASFDKAQGDSVISEKGGLEKGGMPKGGIIPDPQVQNDPLDFPTGTSPIIVGPPAGGPRPPSDFLPEVFPGNTPPTIPGDGLTDPN